MYLTVLKWAIKAAIALGLPQMAARWLKPRFAAALERARAKVEARINKLLADEDEVAAALPSSRM